MTISVARTKFIVNIESFKNQNPDLKDNSSRVYSLAQYFPSIVTILAKYCGNTYEYWVNTWKMCSLASVILTSIVTILLSFEAILKKFSVKIDYKSQFQS